MSSARFLFALNGLGILALMYQYIKQKTNTYQAILAVLVLAGSYVFLERGFRVRSDLLSSFVSLLILVIHVKFKNPIKYYGIFGLLFSLFFITPKSLYWFVLTLLLLFKDSKKVRLAPYILKSLGFFVVLFVLLSFVFQDPLFLKSFQQSLAFFKQSAQNSMGYLLKEGLLATLYDRSHVGSFIENNLFLVLLIFVNILFLLPGFQKLKLFFSKTSPTGSSPAEISPAELSLAQASSTEISSAQAEGKQVGLFNGIFLVLLFIVFFHPQQKMFFLGALMPFFILLFFTHPKWFLHFEAHTRRGFKIALLIFALSASSFSILKFQYQHRSKTVIQKSLLKNWNDFYKNQPRGLKIFDPLCLIYSVKSDCKYLDASVDVKEYLKAREFDVIIPSYGVSDWDILSLKLNSFEYVLVKNKVYYKAFVWDFKNQPKLNSSYLSSPARLSGKKIFKTFSDSLPADFFPPDSTGLNSQSSDSRPINSQSSNPRPKEATSLKASDSMPLDSLSYKSKKYFYLYISSLNRPLDFQKVRDCPKLSKSNKRLKAGCYYTQAEFQAGFLPAKKEKLALFYIKLPPHTQPKDSLRHLFKYDHPGLP